MSLAPTNAVRVAVRVTGLVQGVGFRPFVHRAATELGLAGWVRNDAAGVEIEVEGPEAAVDAFVAQVTEHPPAMARPRTVAVEARAVVGVDGFRIQPSGSTETVDTYVAPDAAVCDDCVQELFDPSDRRHRYPFITCTNCGPRFTITTALPYDRPNTTMSSFALCQDCTADYEDPSDRRFHAQPLACPACGPQLWFDHDGHRTEGTDAVVAAAQDVLADGGVVAIKGIGGYHLACDARSCMAVETLRGRKQRPDKPFAVMAENLDVARRVVDVGDVAAELLLSQAAPITLLPRRPSDGLAEAVAPGNPRLGIVLPYAPLHHLLFAPVPGRESPSFDVLVMTSGNLSNEPICFDDDDARTRLADIADAWLGHDRPIHVPCDDSVIQVDDADITPIRRSRGYAPMPIRLPVEVPATLAVGGELKNTFCLARGRDAWLGQHIGDMGSLETLSAFERSVAQFRSLYAVDPTNIVSDLHPGYQTTAWAERSRHASGQSFDHRQVQHHHAHFAALLAEHEVAAEAVAVGIVLDGTGYGTDGTIWGGEVLVGGYGSVDRVASLRPVPLPGGDAAIRKPYRVALAHLWAAGVEWDLELDCVAAAGDVERQVLTQQLGNGAHTVPTSSAGRLFDAVASILGLRHEVTFEAQAAMELEHAATLALDEPRKYRFALVADEIDPRPVVEALVADVRSGVAVESCAAGFHVALADVLARTVRRTRAQTPTEVVGLTGGVFQNAVLSSLVRHRLEADGATVLAHRIVPPNDGGLALGQTVVATTSPTHHTES